MINSSIAILFNPRKNTPSKLALLQGVVTQLKQLGHTIELHPLDTPNKSNMLITQLANSTTITQIVIAGGDGTMHQFLQTWKNHDIPIGIIPLGTCNMIAHECGYTKDPTQVATLLHTQHIENFYTVDVNQQVMIAVGGCGLDSYTCSQVNWFWKSKLGRLHHIYLLIKTLLFHKRPELKIKIDNQEVTTTNLFISKSHYYGGRMQIAPQASIFNSELYILYFKRQNFWREVFNVIAAARSKSTKDIKVQAVKKLEILSPADQPIQLDGDIRLNTPAVFSVNSKPFKMICSTKAKQNVINL